MIKDPLSKRAGVSRHGSAGSTFLVLFNHKLMKNGLIFCEVYKMFKVVMQL